jgi:hypothetical protein
MTNNSVMLCDGCGQTATGEHISRRLKRLEWTTRYRPVHIKALLLGIVSPDEEKDFFYAPTCDFSGEAGLLAKGAGIDVMGKEREAVHVEFQRAGFFLTHVLECPLEPGGNGRNALPLLVAQRVPAVVARIRRSLKPKTTVLISQGLQQVAGQFSEKDLGCEVRFDPIS